MLIPPISVSAKAEPVNCEADEDDVSVIRYPFNPLVIALKLTLNPLAVRLTIPALDDSDDAIH